MVGKTNVGGGAALIRSIQRGSIGFTDTSTSRTVSIETVDPDCSVVHVTGWTCENWFDSTQKYGGVGMTNGTVPVLTLDDGSTLRIRREAGSGNRVTVNYEIIEFSDVKSIQTGVLSNTKPTPRAVTKTIETVDLDKTMLFAQWVYFNEDYGGSWSTSGMMNNLNAQVYLSDDHTLTCEKCTAITPYTTTYGVSGCKIYYTVAELK